MINSKRLRSLFAAPTKVITAFTICLAAARAQSPLQVNIKDMPEHNIRLIPYNSADFQERFNQIIGTGQDSQEVGLTAQKPFSAILENRSNETLVAYSVRFTHVDLNGKTTTHDMLFHVFDGRLDMRVPPKGTVWITPRRAMTHALNQVMPPELRADALAAVDRLSRLSAITISLDAAIFDDGTFVGANYTHAFEQASAIISQRQAVVNEFVARKSGAQSDGEIADWLASLSRPSVSPSKKETIDGIDWNYRYRQQYSALLFDAYQASGLAAAANLVTRMNTLPTLLIKR